MATKLKTKKKIDQKRERGGMEPKYYEVFARKNSQSDLSHALSRSTKRPVSSGTCLVHIRPAQMEGNVRSTAGGDHHSHRRRQVGQDQDGLTDVGSKEKKNGIYTRQPRHQAG